MYKFKQPLLWFLFLSIIVFGGFSVWGQTQKSKEPKYRYFLRHETEVDEYLPAMDTVNMVLGNMGRSMTVDEANQYRIVFARSFQRLMGKITRDSALIK